MGVCFFRISNHAVLLGRPLNVSCDHLFAKLVMMGGGGERGQIYYFVRNESGNFRALPNQTYQRFERSDLSVPQNNLLFNYKCTTILQGLRVAQATKPNGARKKKNNARKSVFFFIQK